MADNNVQYKRKLQGKSTGGLAYQVGPLYILYMSTTRPEHKIYRHYGLEPILVAFLDEASRERGVSKTQILEEALHAKRYSWIFRSKLQIDERKPVEITMPDIHTKGSGYGD